jgi:hypothetical protein
MEEGSVLVSDQSVLGKYALWAAALSVLSGAALRTANADVAANLTRAAEVVQPLTRTLHPAAAGLSHPTSHSSIVKRPLLLAVPQHAEFAPESQSAASVSAQSRFTAAFPIHWQKDEPQLLRTARTFRKQGLPLVHLWQSDSGEHMLSMGLNSHGVPGIWLTQKVPD